MGVFYSPHVDSICALSAMGLLLICFLAFAFSKANSGEGWNRSFRFLSLAFFCLFLGDAILYWSFDWLDKEWPRILASLAAIAAGIFIYASAIVFSPYAYSWRKRARIFALICAAIVVIGLGAAWLYWNGWKEAAGPVALYYCSRIFFPAPFGFFYFLHYYPDRAHTAAIPKIAVLFLPVLALLSALSPIPGIDANLALQSPSCEIYGVALWFVRLLAIVAAAGLLWVVYAEAMEVSRSVLLWPIFLLAILTLFALGFLALWEHLYIRRQERQAIILAERAAAMAPAGALEEIAANLPQSDPALLGKFFAQIKATKFILDGFVPMETVIDIAVPPPSGQTLYKIDTNGAVEVWDSPARELSAVLGGGAPAFAENDGSAAFPLSAFAPIGDSGGRILGAAVAVVPPAYWAADTYKAKRFVIEFWFVMFLVLTAFLRGQLGAWLEASAAGMSKAWRAGLLGNRLVGIVISFGNTVSDVNDRFFGNEKA